MSEQPRAVPHETLVRFLLGELEEDDRERLEARLLAESDLFDEVRAVEDDLVDAYLRGELGERERRLLEQGPLASDAVAENMAFGRALREAVRRRRSLAPQQGWRERLLGGFVPWGALLRPALAAGLVTALLTGAWMWREQRALRREVTRLDGERKAVETELYAQRRAAANDRSRIAELTEKLSGAQAALESAAGVVRAPLVLALALGSGSLRGGDETRLRVAAGVDAIRLEAEIEGVGAYRGVRAVLRTGAGEQVFAETRPAVREHDGFTTLSLEVPARALVAGGYVLEVDGLLAGKRERLGLYPFRVVRP